MELKDYQQGVLTKFDSYLSTLRGQVKTIAAAQEVWKAQGHSLDLGDPCVKAWDQLHRPRLHLRRQGWKRALSDVWEHGADDEAV